MLFACSMIYMAALFCNNASTGWEEAPSVSSGKLSLLKGIYLLTVSFSMPVDFESVKTIPFPAVSVCYPTSWMWPSIVNLINYLNSTHEILEYAKRTDDESFTLDFIRDRLHDLAFGIDETFNELQFDGITLIDFIGNSLHGDSASTAFLLHFLAFQFEGQNQEFRELTRLYEEALKSLKFNQISWNDYEAYLKEDLTSVFWTENVEKLLIDWNTAYHNTAYPETKFDVIKNLCTSNISVVMFILCHH